MALTGRPDGPPLGAPASVVEVLERAAAQLAEASTRLGRPVQVDGPRLLGERAALMGLARGGRTSCGGATRLLRAADGWVAVCLSRDEDVALLPAWLGVDPRPEHVWPAVAAVVERRPAAAVVASGIELGLPCAELGEPRDGAPPGVRVEAVASTAPARPVRSTDGLRVVDLSSLWAGPLCGQLLVASGLRVVKVESTRRPDGARRGKREFFDLLNAGKECVALDLMAADGVRRLHALVRWADVVIESSRPRALEQLGIRARDVLAGVRTRVWISITGHGCVEPHRHRVGFGDDAAVAGGLVAWDDGAPCFLGDAAPDPASGLLAGTAVVDRLLEGGRWLVDVSLSRTAALLAVGEVTRPWHGRVADPTARPPSGVAPELGADTARVLAEVGVD
jgi:hypothetical protein